MFCERIKVSAKHVSANLPSNLSETSDTYVASKEEMDFYHENGYLLIRGLVDRNDLSKYKQRFTEICNGKEQRATVVKEIALIDKNKKSEEYIYKIQELLYDEVFMTYSENPRILNIVSQFIGNDITAVNYMLINKPPGTVRHSPHQDLYYFPFRPADKLIGVWTAIDPARVLNGCLFVVPGSHKIEKVLAHENRPEDSKKFFHSVVDEEKYAPVEKRVHLEMEPGDTVLLHPYVLHGSGPNLSQDFRKCLTIHYASSNCHYISVAGTVQQQVADEYNREFKKKGIEVDYIDTVKIKCKLVRGVHSNL